MSTTFLEYHEIQSLTNKMRHRAQAQALRAMQLEHKVRPDGSIAILRAHVMNQFGGEPSREARRARKDTVPNWDAI